MDFRDWPKLFFFNIPRVLLDLDPKDLPVSYPFDTMLLLLLLFFSAGGGGSERMLFVFRTDTDFCNLSAA